MSHNSAPQCALSDSFLVLDDSIRLSAVSKACASQGRYHRKRKQRKWAAQPPIFFVFLIGPYLSLPLCLPLSSGLPLGGGLAGGGLGAGCSAAGSGPRLRVTVI